MFTNKQACASQRLTGPRVATPALSPDLVVTARHGQDVSGDGPADVPHHVVELVQQFGRPRVPRGVVTRPDKHPTVLWTEQRQTIRQANVD